MPRIQAALFASALFLVSAPTAHAQSQAGWDAVVTLPVTVIGNDNMTLEVMHQTINGSDQRLLTLIVTPSGGNPATLMPWPVAEVQSFVDATTKVLSVIAQNGSSITVGAQSRPLNVPTFEVRKTGQNGFVVLPQVLAGAHVYALEIYQPIFNPYMYRVYTLAQLKQFIDYLAQGISFVNVLP